MFPKLIVLTRGWIWWQADMVLVCSRTPSAGFPDAYPREVVLVLVGNLLEIVLGKLSTAQLTLQPFLPRQEDGEDAPPRAAQATLWRDAADFGTHTCRAALTREIRDVRQGDRVPRRLSLSLVEPGSRRCWHQDRGFPEPATRRTGQ